MIFMAMLALSACSEKHRLSLLDIMPLQSAIVVETTNPVGQMAELQPYFQTGDVFRYLEQEILYVDSLVFAGEKTHGCSRAGYALVKMPDGYASFVACDMDRNLSNKELMKALEASGLPCESVTLGDGTCVRCDSLFVFTKDGFLVYGSSKTLLQNVLQQFDNPTKITENADFSKVQSTVGNTVSTHVYVNFSMLDDVIVQSAAEKYADGAAVLASCLKGFSGLDMLTKDETIVLNGYSRTSDSTSCLKPLKYQLPVHNSIVNLLPFNTKLMLHFGMSDYLSFWEELVSKQDVAQLNRKYGVEIDKQLLPCLSEVAYCVFGSSDSPLMVARINDPAGMIQFWNKMGTKVGVAATATVQGYTLNQLNANGFVPSVFGVTFNELTKCCYSIVDQYLVVANDMNVLQSVVACYRSGRTLDLNENFKAFQNNMLESANISIYVALAGNQNLIHRLTTGKVAAFLGRNSDFLSQYQAFSLQFASAKDLVYTCACLRKQGEVKQEDNVAWKVNLVAPMKGKPYLLERPGMNVNDIVVFDTENSMYLIDCDGNIVWRNELSETLMSDVFVVKTSDNQTKFMFNTANYLHLIDREGNDADGFPKKLLSEASNGMALIQYEGGAEARAIVCGTDRFVYNYDLNGDEVAGWNRHRTDNLVTRPVQHLVADNKDFLIVTDEQCAIRVLDRQGRVRIPLPSDLHKSQNAVFYENRTNHKGIIITSDEKGDLLYIAMDGGTARTDFGAFGDKHFFLYEDFNANQDPDFIYLEGKTIFVFDRFKKVLYEHEFDAEISSKPQFFNVSRNNRLLGLVSATARELYLIDKNGKMMVYSGLVGGDSFAIGSVHNNNEINLLTGSGTALFNYVIQ